MSDNYLLMKAVDYVDDRYLGKYFSMKEKLSHQKIKRKTKAPVRRILLQLIHGTSGS